MGRLWHRGQRSRPQETSDPFPAGSARTGAELPWRAAAEGGCGSIVVGVDGSHITVFLLDDHEIVRRGLRDLVESEGDMEVIGEAATEDEAVGRVHALDPDVAVLDVRLA